MTESAKFGDDHVRHMIGEGLRLAAQKHIAELPAPEEDDGSEMGAMVSLDSEQEIKDLAAGIIPQGFEAQSVYAQSSSCKIEPSSERTASMSLVIQVLPQKGELR